MTRGRRRSYGTIRDASAYGGKNSTSDRPDFSRPSGVMAWFDGTCPRCDQPIQRHVHQVVERRHEWIHVACAPGQEDE